MSIRVLIVDDSTVVRDVFVRELSRDPEVEVVGTAPDPFVARDKIVELHPDVVTLDIEMPRMDGLTFLRKLMRHHPVPVVIVSSLAGRSSNKVLDAQWLGGVEVIGKPSGDFAVEELSIELIDKIKAAARARLPTFVTDAERLAPGDARADAPVTSPSVRFHADDVVAVGASTGGPQALGLLLSALPASFPPVVIAQHMPGQFTGSFAERLDSQSALRVREAIDGETLEPGTALVAPGGRHLIVRRSGGSLTAALAEGPHVCRHRPSVDVLFKSLVRATGSRSVGVLLTGMGVDGADGLAEIRRVGGRTLAQSKESSVVWGMPGEAVARDAVEAVLDLEDIPERLGSILRARASSSRSATVR